MVIHDQERQDFLAEQRMEQNRRIRERKSPRGMSVITVQCLICLVAVLLAVMLRLVGGEAYQQLRYGITSALNGNELMAVVMRLWDDEPTEMPLFEDVDSVKSDDFTHVIAEETL